MLYLNKLAQQLWSKENLLNGNNKLYNEPISSSTRKQTINFDTALSSDQFLDPYEIPRQHVSANVSSKC